MKTLLFSTVLFLTASIANSKGACGYVEKIEYNESTAKASLTLRKSLIASEGSFGVELIHPSSALKAAAKTAMLSSLTFCFEQLTEGDMPAYKYSIKRSYKVLPKK